MTNESSYPIRFYECNAFGQLTRGNQVRLALEAAREFFIAPEGLENLDRWLLGEVQVAYHGTIEHTETLTIKTEVSGTRDDGLALTQTLTNSTGETVSVVYADWDYIEPTTFEIVTLPADSFPPVKHNEPFDSFPDEPEAPAGSFVAHRRVRPQHVTPFGLAEAGWLIDALEEIHHDANLSVGWQTARPNVDGLMMYATQHNVEWLEPIYEDEGLKFVTYLSEVDEFSVVRWALITRERDEELVGRAQTLWVWADGATLEKTSVPAQYLDDAGDHFAEN